MDLNKQFDITRIVKIRETNNAMEHHFYYLVYCRIYNKEHTKYKKFRYVIDFDIFDVQEYFEKDYYTNDDVKRYRNEIALSTMYTQLKDDTFNDYREFYDFCIETIENYNKGV